MTAPTADTVPSVNAGLTELFAEHTAPTHCCTRRFKAAITPGEEGTAAMRVQLAVYLGQIRKAELAPDFNRDVQNKVNLMRFKAKKAAAAIEAAAEANLAATKLLHELDDAMAEAKETLHSRDSHSPSTPSDRDSH